MSIRQMNGKPFTHFSYADFGTPGRRTRVGRHTSRETAERAVRVMRRSAIYGRLWIENTLGDSFEVA